MRAVHNLALLVACTLVVAVAAASLVASPAAALPDGGGTIKGHIRLAGKLPGNPVIRMGMDPMCARINAGKQVVQEAVMEIPDGSLANVFVEVQGKFSPTPVPAEPVTIDQQGCLYRPRVVGARVGQILQIRNGDALLHNVHSLSAVGNGFNVSQPKAGVVYQFRLKDEELMLRLKCDVHSWMTAYVGVVRHPYFAVSGTTGTFQIGNVPAGTYTVRTWHERYGSLTETVRVGRGTVAEVELTYTGAYTGNEKPPSAGMQDLALPAGVPTAQLTVPDSWR
jgi:hypothetical protein